MKLSALYTVFNGLELLEGSIAQIINEVDLVVISFQEVSNKGERSEEVRSFMRRFEHNPKIDIIEYKPSFQINTKANERNKHQQLIDHAKNKDCTHFFMSACDHYYNSEEFRRFKEVSLKGGYDITFTSMFTYYKRPEWQLTPIESYFMPFICKIHPNTEVKQAVNYPVVVDPSVRVTPWKTYRIFNQDEIMLHHFSMIREDIENKFRNAAASVNWTKEKVEQFVEEYKNAKEGDSISYFQGRKIINVGNHFNI